MTMHPDETLLEYNCLPMGLCISSNAVKATMEEILHRLLI